MTNSLREKLRISEAIWKYSLQRQELKWQELNTLIAQLTRCGERICRLGRLHQRAQDRGWKGAAKRLHLRIKRHSEDLAYCHDTLRRHLAQRVPMPPSQRELLLTLTAIEQEFGGFDYDPSLEQLSVRTEPILLEGQYLGPFEIRLRFADLVHADVEARYEVDALEPYPAVGTDSVTHPHVSDNRLCAGEALAAIRSSVTSGRLDDFFLLVRSVLTTYNPDSAYVRLEDWDGRQCYDCGLSMHDDESYGCDLCCNNFCCDCVSICHQCELPGCLACLRSCTHCDSTTCPSCLTTCESCPVSICLDCLEDDLCPNCIEERENDYEEETTQTNNDTQPSAA